MRSILFGLIAGALGAALWAAIAYHADREIGWIAWAVGAMVGFGLALGSKNNQSFQLGVTAAIIALLSIATGKFAVVHIIAGNVASKIVSDVQTSIGEDECKAHIAHDLAAQSIAENKDLAWPEGKNLDEAEDLKDYPKPIIADVNRRWNAMSADDKSKFQAALKQSVSDQVRVGIRSSEAEIFLRMFGFFDLLWALFAVGSAFRIASGSVSED